MDKYLRIYILGILCAAAVFVSCEKASVTTTKGTDIPTASLEDASVKDPEVDDELSKLLAEQTPIYVPQDEWEGLETRAYPEVNAMASYYIIAHPEGNPDYTWEGATVFDTSRVSVTTKNTAYSIAKDDEIEVTISFAKEDPPSGKYEKIHVHRNLNLDRWNGEEWERMLYPLVNNAGPAKGRQEILVGEALEKTFFLHDIVTVLTPGQYRIIAYVNSQPIYAEFELTE